MSQNHTRRRCGVFGISFVIFSLAFLAPCLRAHAQSATAMATEKEELLLYFSEEEIIATATKQALPLAKVPAVATVITAEQIRNMGARTLFEALKIVPGIGIYQEYAWDGDIEVRGVKTIHSEKVLILLDGIRLNNPLQGSATHLYSDTPLDNVKRIEVVRGPVSALYGANAFVGVINIITKEGGEINGVDIRADGGSFDTQRFNLLAGKKYGDLQVAAQINYLESDGDRQKIQQDAIGNSGRTDNWRRRMDVGLTTSWKNLRLEYRHTDKHFGPYIGATSSLNDESHIHFTEDVGELSYRYTVVKGLDILARVYGGLFKLDIFWELFPEGFAGVYPDGVLGNPRLKDRTYGAELQVDYQLFKNNVITAGVNTERLRQYDVQHWANFDPTSGAPLAGGFQNISDTLNWNRNVHRRVFAWYLQDAWNIVDKLQLIAGVRHDQYSDFGNTTNPRAGLVWEFLKDSHLKVLAGKAFRAPNFEELYNDHNPAATGNLNLKPERITTTELSIETRALKPLTLKAAYFKNYINNTIRLVSGQHQNTGRDRYAGLEFEARYDFSKAGNAYANLTWLEPKRLGSGGEITDIPKWRSNIGGNVAFARYFNFNTNIFISGDRPRAAGDWRKDIPSYAVIDTALTFKNFWKGLEIQLLAKNLLDKRYDDPAPVSTIPGDYPRDGREIFVEARYTF